MDAPSDLMGTPGPHLPADSGTGADLRQTLQAVFGGWCSLRRTR
jgi:hypothetical protein